MIFIQQAESFRDVPDKAFLYISSSIINFFKGHYCVLFDFGVGRILPDYNKPCPECPSVYSSNESSTCKIIFLIIW